jgi:CubicO group peptidase (beta-lactamase class C family)
MSEATRFAVASVTKMVTATTALRSQPSHTGTNSEE